MVERHWRWVRSARVWEKPLDAYSGLADIYLSHPDFVERYEAIEPFLATAMKSWVKQRSQAG